MAHREKNEQASRSISSSSFVIRCKTPKGQYTISDLESNSTIKTLKEAIMKISDLHHEKLKILTGFPPKPIRHVNDDSKLNEVGIESGETLIIQIDDTLDGVPKELSMPTASEINFKKRKQDSPTEVKHVKEFKATDFASSSAIMMRYEVPSDNSCLFSSISFIMNDGILDLKDVDRLRRIVGEAVLKDPVTYNAAILGRENHDYSEWIQNPVNWGGAIDLRILSDHFQLEICAIIIQELSTLRYGELKNYGRRCILLYDGVHYDPLYVQCEDQMQTIFLNDDYRVMELALELAREARSCKQYTDTANFQLRCNDCGMGFKGEKEATAHAAATGHVRFGELK